MECAKGWRTTDLAAGLWLALLLATGLVFTSMGFVLARGNRARLLQLLAGG